jgi:hypothetical protein
MGMLVLLVGYGVIVTTRGGYRPDDYMRVHIVFDPLLIVLFWTSLSLLLGYLSGFVRRQYILRRHELAELADPSARTKM